MNNLTRIVSASLVALSLITHSGHLYAQTDPGAAPAPENPFPNRLPAAELDGGQEWLNTSGPISLKDLRGKVVLLDFWTYCCINCMHVLPDLAYLEKKYPNELVVIGVHSAKFDNEKESGNIRKAILRYEIEHPVVNDASMVIWRKFAVRAWPTLVVIDPEGYYCGYVSGEGNRELLEKVVDRLIAYHRSKKTLDETPVRFDLERARQPETPLRFPGKVLADQASQRLFVSDSNHNRIVVASLDGTVQEVIGRGTIGRVDGSYAEAEFDHPQGMALVDQKLYVADTENHLIRVVDLTQKTVATLAGTGVQGHTRKGAGTLRETAIASPWDVLHLEGVLYIAMAGPHQIWSHRLGTDSIQPYAGSGREDIINGPLESSALAQPSGLATDGRFLYVCDSEGSAIRKITTRPDNNLASPIGTVTTVAGTSDLPNGRSLFEFGDEDGPVATARLQHPLGVACHEGQLLIADTYNHKIRLVNPMGKTVSTWLMGADPQTSINPPGFSEPAGLSIAGSHLYVADTNNHRICRIDLNSKAMTVLPMSGLTPPAITSTSEAESDGTVTKVPTQKIAIGPEVTLQIKLALPTGYKLSPAAPVTYEVRAEGEQAIVAAEALAGRDEAEVAGDTATIKIPLTGKAGTGVCRLRLTYTYCRDGASGLCKLGTGTWSIPLEVATDGTRDPIGLTTSAE